MKFLTLLAFTVSPFLLFMLLPATGQEQIDNTGGIAVVELFTSQGCSSCPPADKVLGKLVQEARAKGQKVYALSMHVDYWDYLGWKDPYSKDIFSQRQRSYAGSYGSNRIYTPQMIVNGTREFVGSREAEAHEAVGNALRQPARMSIQLQGRLVDGKVEIDWKLEKPSSDILNIALVRAGISNDVSRGENRGRKLSHTNVVLEFDSHALRGESEGQLQLPLPEADGQSNYEIIAYLQDDASRQIVAAEGISLFH